MVQLSPLTLGLRVNQKSLPKYLLIFGGPNSTKLSTTYAKKKVLKQYHGKRETVK